MSRFPLPFPRTLRILAISAAALSALSLGGCGLLSMAIALAPLKLMFACLPEGTEIDVPGGQTRAIETLRSGDLVIGYDGGPVQIMQIHGYLEDAEESVFHAITFSNGSIVNLCSMHRIEGIRAKDLTVGQSTPGGLSVVEAREYRGVERSYDILTEDEGYRIGGVSVNSMIEEMYEAGQRGKMRR